MEVNIKYFDEQLEEIKKVDKGDWIDLRCVGGRIVVIHNNIKETPEGLKLSRATSSVNVKWEDGYIDDGEAKEYVKFFRYSKGDFLMLDLGIAMQLPKDYEANVVPRSSTFKNFTILQTNSFGVIDESYCGNNDKWFMPVLAMQDGFVIYNERLCQFRINKKMESVELKRQEKFNTENRGGHGSTGTK